LIFQQPPQRFSHPLFPVRLPAGAEPLDKLQEWLKIPAIREKARSEVRLHPNMNPTQNSPAKRLPEPTPMERVCRHPRVRVVARDEDAEFVECQECGDVFESSEFKDMAIEENIRPDEA
jgi:hypothetical protein